MVAGWVLAGGWRICCIRAALFYVLVCVLRSFGYALFLLENKWCFQFLIPPPLPMSTSKTIRDTRVLRIIVSAPIHHSKYVTALQNTNSRSRSSSTLELDEDTNIATSSSTMRFYSSIIVRCDTSRLVVGRRPERFVTHLQE